MKGRSQKRIVSKIISRTITIVMCLIITFSMGNITSSARNLVIDIRINNQRLLVDSDPYIENGHVMVPLRAVAEALGVTDVLWMGDRFVALIFEEKVIMMVLDSCDYWVDGEIKEFEVAPTISNGRTMISVRALAEEISCDVTWNNDYSTVEIIKPDITVDPSYLSPIQYTYEDLLWLARITHVEGLNIGYDAKLAIANVVLNRVKSPIFPNTVADVIFETAYAVQFPPAHKDGFDTLEPSPESWRAAQDALKGANNISTCLYFNNSPFRSKSDDLYLIIEGEYFYY